MSTVALLQMLLSEKIKEFETTEAELERQIEELQKKHHDARSEIDDYQRRYWERRECHLCRVAGDTV